MNTKVKSTVDPRGDQPAVENQPVGQEKTPVFRVQTGMRAGGFYENFYNWWAGVAEGFNAADRATGAGG